MNLKEYIFYSGMTLKQFAKHAEIHDSYLSSILSGGRRPSKRMLQSIEIATGGWVKAKDVCAPTTVPIGFVPVPIPEIEQDDDEGGKAA